MKLDRREFMGALAAASALTMIGSPAFAQSRRIVVANWGGDWNGRTVEYIEKPLLEDKGYKIVRDLGGSEVRFNKLLAERNLPRGTLDVAHFGENQIYLLEQKDVIEPLDFDKIPNAETIIPALRHSSFMPWLFSTWELVYNPAYIKSKPTSYTDMWNKDLAGKVGVMNANYANAMQAASLIGSGKMNDFAAAKETLLAWKQAVKPAIYESHQQAAEAMKNEDIWIVANYRARGLQWQNDGINCATAYPKEGGITTVFGAVIPKRASNKDGAYAYLNALLDPDHIGDLCAQNFYAPSITAAKLAPEVASKVSYSDAEQASLQTWDLKFWAENKTEWLDWWKKEFVAG